jgi:hypothetical protein
MSLLESRTLLQVVEIGRSSVLGSKWLGLSPKILACPRSQAQRHSYRRELRLTSLLGLKQLVPCRRAGDWKILLYIISSGLLVKRLELTMIQLETPEREVVPQRLLDRWLPPAGVLLLQERVRRSFQRLREVMPLALERKLVGPQG